MVDMQKVFDSQRLPSQVLAPDGSPVKLTLTQAYTKGEGDDISYWYNCEPITLYGKLVTSVKGRKDMSLEPTLLGFWTIDVPELKNGKPVLNDDGTPVIKETRYPLVLM